MNFSKISAILIAASLFMLFMIGCENSQSPHQTFDDVLQRIPDIQLIEGAENATLNVDYDRDRSYFRISVSNVTSNSIPHNSVFNAWCIELDKPLSRGRDLTEAQLYATGEDALINKLAYIINNRGALERQNPGLSWKEIQVAFWVILETRDMNLQTIANRIPSAVEGYKETYVNNIISDVQTNGSSFTPGVGHTQLILMNAGEDEQLTVGESNTAWARMNNDPDDFTYTFNPKNGDPSEVGGGNWATYIKVTPPENEADKEEFYLFAGQTNFVGYLFVWRDGDNLYVEYDLIEDYVLSITHVHVGLVFPDDFPTTANEWENPQVGQFEYGDSYDNENNVTETIPWDSEWNGQELIIAAHAVVWEVDEI